MAYSPYASYANPYSTAPQTYGPPSPVYGPTKPTSNTSSSNVNTVNSTQQSNPTQTADQYYNQLSGKENGYYNDLMGQYGNQHNLVLQHLDAEHKLAVGNNDPQHAQFLENVANQAENDQGRNQFDYNTSTGRENTSYGLNSTANSQNFQTAMAKLNNDDFTARQTLQRQQGVSNENTSEDLNSRGLLTGQTPGGTNQNQVNTTNNPGAQPLTGLGGLAGAQAGVQNSQFGGQFGALSRNLGVNTQGVTNTFNQNQNMLGFNHTNTLQDITTNARRSAQDESLGNNYAVGSENNQNNVQTQALQRARAKALQSDKLNAYGSGATSAGILGS